MNSSTAENLMRSAKAPTIRQQVMAAKVAWKTTNTISGITTPLLKVAAFANSPLTGSNTPFKNTRERPPTKGLPSVNARL
jgi:hypothetical protein